MKGGARRSQAARGREGAALGDGRKRTVVKKNDGASYK